MKVLLIVRGQSGVPGGAGVPGGQIGMIQIAKALARIDVAVELFVGGPRMSYLDGLDGVTTKYFRWPIWFDRLIKDSPARVRSLGTNLRRRRWLQAVSSLTSLGGADVIHVQGLKDGEALLTAISGPLVVTHWGRVGRWLPRESEPNENEDLQRRVRLLRDNVRLVAIGEAQAASLRSAGLPPADIIQPGIDLQHFSPGDRAEARRRVNLPADAAIVLYVGRLAPDKNVETLLTAFARLPPRSPRPHLLIVGDGPLGPQLRLLSSQLGIAAFTTFLPFVPHQDLPWYYRSADVAVVPSNYLETFCMVALEAIACRCPLIVTDQVPEILRRFPTVPSVGPYDVDALCGHISAALGGDVKPAEDARMADYDWSGVARRYLDFYNTALRRTK
ncbi:MAG: glycosyltransferase family 4 protein [Pyrinomonadaceae bacterium]